MLKLPDQELSYWLASSPNQVYPPLAEDVAVDVAIVGGGIAGITAAYLLKKAGLTVAVIEKDIIGGATTGNTTGKVTSQHNLIYHELNNRVGEKIARLYGVANQEAIKHMETVIRTENIECDWQAANNYVFTTDPERIQEFKAEAGTAAKLGLPASFSTDVALPFSVECAVKFSDQAHMNAQQYVHGLARAVAGQMSHVFEHSRVIGMREGNPGKVRTKNAAVSAKHIIVATNVPTFPLMARGGYCALEYPHTSYIVAGYIKEKLNGMYISPDEGQYSLLPVQTSKGTLLLVGGGKHIPGLGRSKPRYEKLAGYANQKFDIKEIAYHWKARDYTAYDNIPLVGKLYPWSKSLYTVTAFGKWGLTNSMVAGTILRDLIINQPNPYTEVYNPIRIKPVTSIPHRVAKSIFT